jgi:hypothetical protein
MLVVIMPCSLLFVSTVVDFIDDGILTIIYRVMFYIVAFSQIVFIVAGGYIGERLLIKYYGRE